MCSVRDGVVLVSSSLWKLQHTVGGSYSRTLLDLKQWSYLNPRYFKICESSCLIVMTWYPVGCLLCYLLVVLFISLFFPCVFEWRVDACEAHDLLCLSVLFLFFFTILFVFEKKVSNICAGFPLGISANFIQSGAILTVELLQSAGVLLCSL